MISKINNNLAESVRQKLNEMLILVEFKESNAGTVSYNHAEIISLKQSDIFLSFS